MSAKAMSPEVENYLMQLPWQGNVRQLENTCRWLMVMAPGQIVQIDDLPTELANGSDESTSRDDWQHLFRQWASAKALSGQEGALAEVIPRVEQLLMEVALEKTAGKRQEAAKLLGWGRNTLTRKLKEQ